MQRTSFLEIFLVFLRLGLTSFGGPIAHLGYFRHEFVVRRQWLDEHAYADLVALCQFLPGPASSQVGIALGLLKGGLRGALAAWLGFTLPSAIALVLFGTALTYSSHVVNAAWLHGLMVVAVAVVAQAVWGMGKSLCPDPIRASMAVSAALVVYLMPGAPGQIGAILLGGLSGWLWLSPAHQLPHSPLRFPLTKTIGAVAIVIFAALLLLLPLAVKQHGDYPLRLFASFFQVGALVFGGGHVVLPLLQAQVVPAGWLSNDTFLAGYGAAQAVPGPLFTFAAYLGAVSSQTPHGWIGAGIALTAIFLPSFLLLIGALPYWESLRHHVAAQKAMMGVNAAVVGLLLSAFYQPVWTSAIRSQADFVLAIAAFLLLMFWKTPPWLVVLLCALVAGLWLQ
jgi:chromate transporter